MKHFGQIMMMACLGWLLLVAPQMGQVQAQPDGMADLWLRGGEFATGLGMGYALSETGLTVAETAVLAIYTSPVITAPISFNAVVPQWAANTSDHEQLELKLRTASASGVWSDWYDIHPHGDWTLPDDPDFVGDMILAPTTDGGHQAVQFTVYFHHLPDMPAPELTQLRLTFLNTMAGPTTAELLAQQQARDAATASEPQTPDAYPKPAVISRDVWCVPYYGQDCYPTDLQYYPVTHLILHHTVTANDYTDSAAVMRAIWQFHTFSRGWGDIGYNYLVDLSGVLFEGHYGGDNVVGTHASDANEGSMALSLIGTFTGATQTPPGIQPPAAMLNAAAALFAWKADQRDINVFAASRTLPNVPWGLPNLMGHRDVYGGTATTCPGDQAYVLLPWLRQEVADRIGLTDPHIYVDELSGQFSKSNANWYEGPAGCGHNGHSYYTWSTTDPAQSANWGEWRPNVPVNGRYRIEIYAPYCDTDAAETAGAIYTIQHMHGSSTVTISQEDQVGLWMSLGEFDLNAGTGNVIRLTDLTHTDNDLGIWFDALRLQPIEGAPTLVSPAADVWLNNPLVTFTWAFDNPSMVVWTRLQVATDSGFANLVWDQAWNSAVTSMAVNLGQEYPHLYWRVIMTSTLGNTIYSNTGHLGLDLTAPTSAVTHIYQIPGHAGFLVSWAGSDTLSGVQGYNLSYRAEGDVAWTTWKGNTSLRSDYFYPPDGRIYWLRSQAIDIVGNVEPANANGDLATSQAILLSHAIMLPIVARP